MPRSEKIKAFMIGFLAVSVLQWSIGMFGRTTSVEDDPQAECVDPFKVGFLAAFGVRPGKICR